ncbi:putative acetyltransferase [Cribrihabitans marinus]|uniref:Putative acetyltransferase n=1 Tax=Cribrihabitans marinus TaxID=1227549 RepID=A0A1H7CUV1_9RHOB|nr:GNAT family N-acetyltransferase [Cribrihabitans marinus]GGH36085.1 N-acetyltransferase [Cribrihabitans marinus]SEJ90962.1 putative acetyltransferase [Cribrihabitans marinus]
MTGTAAIGRDRPDDPAVVALLQQHFALMRATSPEESCHVLKPGQLLDSGAVVVTARQDGAVLGVGALTRIGPDHGELKSMHTARAARGRGIGRDILTALMQEARAQGLTRLSLETGSQPDFAAARALYAANGFEICPPFGAYVSDPLSVFMTRRL